MTFFLAFQFLFSDGLKYVEWIGNTIMIQIQPISFVLSCLLLLALVHDVHDKNTSAVMSSFFFE